MKSDIRRRRTRRSALKQVRPVTTKPASAPLPIQPPVSTAPAAPVARRPIPEVAPVSVAPAYQPPAPRAVAAPVTKRRIKQAAITALTLVALVGVGMRAQADTGRTKEATISDVTAATDSLKAAKDSLVAGDFAAAEQKFAAAQQSLHEANLRLSERGQLGGALPPVATGQIAGGRDLVATSEELANSGQRLSGELNRMTRDLTAGGDPYKAGEVLAARVQPIQRDLAEADSRLKSFSQAVHTAADSGGFGAQAEALQQLDRAMPGLTAKFEESRKVADAMPSLLGMDTFKQYLILFQNPAEARGTGGFIGTYGRLTLDDGRIKELNVDSIYNPANQANKVIKDDAPPPYARFAEPGQKAIWAMQNANYSPDFPTTAKRFQQNFEQAGGSTADGVIGLTIQPIVEILKVTGPIEMPEYGYTLTADNFQTLIQADQLTKATEGEQDPKKILRDFTPKLIQRIGAAPVDQQKKIMEIFGQAIESRDLAMTFRNDDLDSLANQLHARGTLTTGTGSLAVIDDNVGGFKSSLDISTDYQHKLTVAPNGTVTGELTVTRTHSGETSQDINKNFTRLFLPKGTRLTNLTGALDTTGPLVREEDGHQVIGAWTDVNPGESRTTTFTYVWPERIDLNGGTLPVMYQKQGGRRANYRVTLSLPKGYAWQSPKSTDGGRTLVVDNPAGDDYTNLFGFEKR